MGYKIIGTKVWWLRERSPIANIAVLELLKADPTHAHSQDLPTEIANIVPTDPITKHGMRAGSSLHITGPNGQ